MNGSARRPDTSSQVLKGRVAVITGAAGGIGRATAVALARRGVDVVVADVDEDGMAAAVEEVAGAGAKAIAVRCDVGADADLEAVRTECIDAFGRVDILMNNVGVLSAGLPEDMPVDEWVRVLDLNVVSVARGLAAFLPTLLRQGSGHIVNTSSSAGFFPYAYDRLPYAASKAAVLSLSENLAIYLRPRGIGVSCLVPASIPTGIGRSMRWFGAHRSIVAPALAPNTAEQTGELVADAIEHGRFLVLTAPEAMDIVRRRAADVDAYLRDLS